MCLAFETAFVCETTVDWGTQPLEVPAHCNKSLVNRVFSCIQACMHGCHDARTRISWKSARYELAWNIANPVSVFLHTNNNTHTMHREVTCRDASCDKLHVFEQQQQDFNQLQGYGAVAWHPGKHSKGRGSLMAMYGMQERWAENTWPPESWNASWACGLESGMSASYQIDWYEGVVN